MSGKAFGQCSACAAPLINYIDQSLKNDQEQLLPLLSDRSFLEKITGLDKVHEAAATTTSTTQNWDGDDEDDF